MSEETPENTTAIEKMLSPDALRNISSFDDAIRLLQDEMGATLYDASTEIGDGFTVLEDKDRLIDMAFVAVGWSFHPGEFPDPKTGELGEFVVMRVVTSRGDKHVLIDGGTGIARQMREFTDRTGTHAGLVVKGGLRKSEYDNEYGHGVTHYLSV